VVSTSSRASDRVPNTTCFVVFSFVVRSFKCSFADRFHNHIPLPWTNVRFWFSNGEFYFFPPAPSCRNNAYKTLFNFFLILQSIFRLPIVKWKKIEKNFSRGSVKTATPVVSLSHHSRPIDFRQCGYVLTTLIRRDVRPEGLNATDKASPRRGYAFNVYTTVLLRFGASWARARAVYSGNAFVGLWKSTRVNLPYMTCCLRAHYVFRSERFDIFRVSFSYRSLDLSSPQLL